MPADIYFVEHKGKKFFRRRGGNRIEAVTSFRVLRNNPRPKLPEVVARLEPRLTADEKFILFDFCNTGPRMTLTARRVRKDGTFLLPQTDAAYIIEPEVEEVSSTKVPKPRKAQ